MSDDHPKYLQHHFATLEQQRQAASLGMWLFLAQEIMFFGGMFLGYAVYRTLYPEAFVVGSSLLSIGWGAFNTVVLIVSSLTVALAVRSAQLNRPRALIGFLAATMVLGTVFLGIKGIEYHEKWSHHLVPGQEFHFDPHHAEATGAHGEEILDHVEERHVQIFYSFYFVMTGMHALHMIIGIGLMVWLLVKAVRREFAANYYSPVEVFGLYWHFVDVIWIFLFPLLYLVGRHL